MTDIFETSKQNTMSDKFMYSMYYKFKTIGVLFLVVLFLSRCANTTPNLETGTDILDFSLSVSHPEKPNTDPLYLKTYSLTAAKVDEANSSAKIAVQIDFGSDLKTNVVSIGRLIVSRGATYTPAMGQQLAFDATGNASILVKAENGTEKTFTLTVTVAPASTEAELKSFKVYVGTKAFPAGGVDLGTPYSGTCDQDTKECIISVPATTTDAEIQNLGTEATYSEGATISPMPQVSPDPEKNFDFTSPQQFIITAQDKTTMATYEVRVRR